MLETPQRLRGNTPGIKKRPNPTPANMRNTHALKEKLLREMLELNKQREEMEIGASHVDFAMLQTYKEMSHSRQRMLDQLNKEL